MSHRKICRKDSYSVTSNPFFCFYDQRHNSFSIIIPTAAEDFHKDVSFIYHYTFYILTHKLNQATVLYYVWSKKAQN